MLTINIICVGKIKEKFFKDAISEYSKRLSKYCKLNILELPDEKIPEKINDSISNEIKEKEYNKSFKKRLLCCLFGFKWQRIFISTIF